LIKKLTVKEFNTYSCHNLLNYIWKVIE
jgi:hypothetical protein